MKRLIILYIYYQYNNIIYKIGDYENENNYKVGD